MRRRDDAAAADACVYTVTVRQAQQLATLQEDMVSRDATPCFTTISFIAALSCERAVVCLTSSCQGARDGGD
jgi:hypothetical protein